VHLLREAGYINICPQFPSAGSDPVTPNADQDIALAQKHIRQVLDDGSSNVILIGHSWGGTVASCAAKGFSKEAREAQGKKTHVQAILYICAFILPAGVSLNGSLPGGKLPPFYNVKVRRTQNF
jgi:pimeloyl-ACP methyl ester carboxylesterase